MNKKSNTKIAYLLVSFFFGTILGALSLLILISFFSPFSKLLPTSRNVGNETYFDDKYINEVVETLKSKYIENLDNKDFTYGVVKGIIEALDDEYTAFLDPEEAKQYMTQRSGDFEGIGISLSSNTSSVYISSVLKGYPAEKAGLKPKDVITEVDGRKITVYEAQEVAKLIRGKEGTEVNLKITRSNQTLGFKIKRQKIVVDNIQWEKINSQTVKINISQFSDETLKDFIANWDKVRGEIKSQVKDLKGIIVDLRGNPGGFVSGVKYILEDFLKKDQIIFQESSKANGVKKYEDNREGSFENQKIVVLVNEGSASASEIFAAGIQENKRGVVVGMPTVGKGVEQELVEFSDGSLLMVVFQQWLTPNGNKISKDNSIKPDHKVDYTQADFDKGVDPQLEKAKSLL